MSDRSSWVIVLNEVLYGEVFMEYPLEGPCDLVEDIWC